MKQIEREPHGLKGVHVLFENWKLILAISGLSVVAAFVLSEFRPPVYESRAEILIKLGRQTVQQNPTRSDVAVSSFMAQWEQAVKSEIEILRNQYLSEKVVDVLGPDFDAPPPAPAPTTLLGRIKSAIKEPLKKVARGLFDLLYRFGLLERLPPREAAIKRVLGGLIVNNIEDSSVIEVIFRSSSPTAAPLVLNQVITFYLDHHNSVHHTPGVFDFFESQGELYASRLSRAENELETFRRAHNIANIQAQIDYLLSSAQTFKTKRSEFELELTEVLHKFPEDSPYVKNKKALIQQTTEGYEKELAQLKQLNDLFIENKRLERNLELAEDANVIYLKKREEQRILDGMDVSKISNVSIIQPPSTPLLAKRIVPYFPDRTLYLILGAFLGCIVGTGLAVLFDFLDTTIRLPADVEQIVDVPVWGVIPEDRGFCKIS